MAQLFAKAFYSSKEWVQLRQNLLIERGLKCEECGRVVVNTAQLIGHHTVHLTPANITNPSIALNPDLIKLICTDCHNKEHKRYGYNNRREVFLVYGSPLSGKSEWVNQMLEPGDMVLDLDKLFEAISGQPLYVKPDNLRFNVFALRDKMLDMIKTRYGKWNNAYVIGGYPEKSERERVARELGAELIYCESSKAECYAKADLQGVLAVEWKRYIDKWFMQYTA